MQTKNNLHRIRLQAILCLLLAGIFYFPVQGQYKTEEIFSSIPIQLRARLAERLNLLVDYQRTQQWEKQYDLLSELFTQGKTKGEYVKLNRHYYTEVVPDDLILDFTPKSVTVQSESVDYGEWTIFGCAKLRKNGSVMEFYASVEAYREREDWYFSPVGIITPIGGQPAPCPYTSASACSSCRSMARSKKSAEGRQP